MEGSSTGSVTSTQSKVQMKPWTGPLPCPQISLKCSINEVIAKALESPKLSHSSTGAADCRQRPSQTSGKIHSNSEICGSEREFRNSNECRVSHEPSGESRAKPQSIAQLGAQNVFSLYPSVLYQAVPCLVGLFARVGKHTGSHRVPHIHHYSTAAATSYTDAVRKPMDHGRANGGANRGGPNNRYGGSSTGQGAGQGALFGRGGFPPATRGFHLGYAGQGQFAGRGAIAMEEEADQVVGTRSIGLGTTVMSRVPAETATVLQVEFETTTAGSVV
jgi:hypothetical protein